MQVTLTCSEAELGPYPKARICRLQWFDSLWPTRVGLPLAICNLYSTAELRPSSLVGQWDRNVPEPCCQGERTSFHWSLAWSQITFLLLLSQSLRDAWKKSSGSSLLSGYGGISCTTDLSTPRACRVSLLLSQGCCWRQTVILWQKKSSSAFQHPALHLTISGPRTSPCTASILSCAASGLRWTCC